MSEDIKKLLLNKVTLYCYFYLVFLNILYMYHQNTLMGLAW